MRAVSKALGAIVTMAALAAAASGAASAATASPAATPSHAVDGPSGFYYGTDSLPAAVTGHGPYFMPGIGAGYGGFVEMAGNWARVEGCRTGNFLNQVPSNSAQANANYTKYGAGIGTAVYWYMGGPGVDPHWNGTAAEASHWGAVQAADTLSAMKSLNVTYPVVWADIELPGIQPAPDNGWNGVYSSPCSEVKIRSSVPASVDRAEFNGYAAYITTHSRYKVGVYSSAPVWTSIFGTPATTGTASLIPNTYEWTYLPETSSISARPYGWCLAGGRGCAQFFGGQTSASKYALMWQWSGGGGVLNSYHTDFDQIDSYRMK